ncbi:class F sortase [Streptomyces sp. V2]|uniref:Class F sortase n=1 Tax=Streptomyces niveiscabiei TaxID=164115 RepID=A0ABW9HXC7_9ACTN|nr:class F sortase [Streptomyces sp. V2]
MPPFPGAPASPGAGPGPRGRRRPPVRPWYRTRAYRLTRTLVVAAALTTGCVWWAGDPEPPTVSAARAPGADAKSVLAESGAGSGPSASGAGEGRASSAARPGAGNAAPPSRPGAGSVPPASGADPGKASGVRDAAPGKASGARDAAPYPSPSRATRLVIPYLDVDAPVMPLSLDRARRLTVPPGDDPNLVGWYTGGPAPGGSGTAVAVGHLDTDTAGAVFAGLEELTPGHLVEVRRADGRTAVYTVDTVTTYDKKSFPDREVYGDRGRAELRLITCAGRYDRRTGYSGNTVVFAHLTGVRGR